MFSFSFTHYVHRKINKGERKTNVKKKKERKRKITTSRVTRRNYYGNRMSAIFLMKFIRKSLI